VPPDTLEERIRENLAAVRSRIGAAARAAGRSPGEIRLIAVSKYMPPAYIGAALAAGQHVFGENTVQEAMNKIPLFAGSPIEWHFIGHLQTNKAKHIPGNFAWVHSLDGLRLAERLANAASRAGVVINVLAQINVTGEGSQSGIAPDALPAFVDAFLGAGYAGLRLRGLMTIGPYEAAPDEIRRCFARLRGLGATCAERFGQGCFTELSMGMSGDFEQAILEGATMVRVGTAIFGERDYSPR
jgi:pyridoxal phosphate enzyme (YggS family)